MIQIEWWHLITSELLGAFTLGLLGGAISANIALKNTKCSLSTLFTGAFGWGIAIMTGVIFALALKGAGQLNPIVTIAMAIGDKSGNWGFGGYTNDVAYPLIFTIVLLIQLVAYILAQVVVDTIYWGQIKDSLSSSDPEDAFSVLSIHASSPVREYKFNIIPFFAEFVASSVFVLSALFIFTRFGTPEMPEISSALVKVFLFTVTIMVVLMALGGITGPSVNPSREMAAIIVYLLIPSKNKAKVNWKYTFVPLLAPIMGSALASVIYRFALK